MTEITDPKLKSIIEQSYAKHSINSNHLRTLASRYNLNWSDEDMKLLDEYIEKHGGLPDNPELFCEGCRLMKPVSLIDFIISKVKFKARYLCASCHKEIGYRKWLDKCIWHGFDEELANLRLSSWDVEREPIEQIRLKEKMSSYIKNFPDVKNLFITGKTGTGKSRFAETIGIELLRKKFDVFYSEYHSFTREGKLGKSFDKWIRPDLVILDDFTEEGIGFEYSTWVFPILNRRYRLDKKTILTCNFLLEELEKSKRNDSVRLASRFNSNRYERILFRIEKDLRRFYD